MFTKVYRGKQFYPVDNMWTQFAFFSVDEIFLAVTLSFCKLALQEYQEQ